MQHRVLRIITRLNVGGPSIQAIRLAEGMPGRGFPTTLVAGLPGRAEGDLAPRARRAGVDLVVLPALRRPLSPIRDLAALLGLVSMIRRIRPAIVHTHQAKAGAIGRVAAALAGTPVRVHTFHGHVFSGYFSGAASRVAVLAERLLARITDRFVAVGPTVRDEICDRYRITGAERVEVIPLGVPPGHLGSARRDGRTIGFAGRLVPVKDPILFLRAARRIAEAIPGLAVRIAGDGPLRPRVWQAARRLGLDGAVRIDGWVEPMARFYGEVDVLLLTSINEGTPRTVIEAQAAGIPVVATDVGGVRDLFTPVRAGSGGIVCEEGVLVARHDPDAIADAATALIRDPRLRARMGEAGRRRAARDHPEEIGMDRVADLYRRLLAAAGMR